MERSEPALVPEWLRCSGNATGRGSSAHHFVSPSSYSDDSPSAPSARNQTFRSISDKDGTRSAFLDRTSSLTSRRNSSCNGSTKHPYSSFTRSHRDRNRDKEKDKSLISEIWSHESSDLFEGVLANRVDKHTLIRSQSLVSRKAVEILPRGDSDLQNGTVSNNTKIHSGNGMLSKCSNISGIQKAAFEKDFPSLGSEEKQVLHDIGRIPSPGLNTAVQTLPVGSGVIGRDKWTSALAEVPASISSSSAGHSSVQKVSAATPALGASSTMASLNMAEALSQVPSRARAAPQVPDKIHRLEELAIKQSRQLIPVIPSNPKSLVLNSSDKLKQSKNARTVEINTAKTMQLQQPNSSQLGNHPPRGGQRSDATKGSQSGKFLVLKPVWENGVSSAAKDGSTLINAINGAAQNLHAVAASASSTPSLSRNAPKPSTLERKAAALAVDFKSITDKRPSLSQAQSRSDFFNLIRKKTSPSSSSSCLDSTPAVGSIAVEKSSESIVVLNASLREGEVISNIPSGVDAYEEYQGVAVVEEKDMPIDGAVYPDEEEAAFLRSLGWEENAGEDEGLTEEEINAFYQEYMKLRPSLKVCQGAEPKSNFQLESQDCRSARPFSELCSPK